MERWFIKITCLSGCDGQAGRHPREEEKGYLRAEKIFLRAHGVRSCDSARIHKDPEQGGIQTRLAGNDRRYRIEYSVRNVRRLHRYATISKSNPL